MRSEVDQLWLDAAARIRSARGWSLEPASGSADGTTTGQSGSRSAKASAWL